MDWLLWGRRFAWLADRSGSGAEIRETFLSVNDRPGADIGIVENFATM
jgi:hypothetical protein